MRRSLLFALSLSLLTAAGCLVYAGEPEPGPPDWHPGAEVEISFFYDALDPYGDWLWVEPWGWVWTPWDVEPGWRPYTHGRWAYTHLGWTWIAEEAWGWAPYHYGRWAYEPLYGWYWIPDTVWAPAWVAWRHGHGWIGWAPLPPRARWVAGVGLDLDGLDLDVVLEEHWWSFVDERDFLAPRIRPRLSPPPRNVIHLRETRDVTRYEELERHVAVHGIDVDELELRVGRVERHVLEDLDRPPRAARVRPTPKPPPPAVSERELRTWEEEQRRRLEQVQRQERRKPPETLKPGEIEERQREERRALEREVERVKEVAKNRREQQTVKPDTKPEPKKPRRKPPEGG